MKNLICFLLLSVLLSLKLNAQTAETEPNDNNTQAAASNNNITANGDFTGSVVDNPFVPAENDIDHWLFPYGSSGTINISVIENFVEVTATTRSGGYDGSSVRETLNITSSNSPQSHQVDATNYTSLKVESIVGTRSYTITIADGSILPVELSAFSAIPFENGVKLSWETATEINNYGFDIERKQIDNLNQDTEWTKIGFVYGHGNSNSPKTYEIIDDVAPDNLLQYRLKQIDTDGKFTYYNTIAEINNGITNIESDALPVEFALYQNFPNPFNPTTNINFSIPEFGAVRLAVYNFLGQEVAELINKNISAGNYNVEFNASNIPSGIYIYKIQFANRFRAQQKMLVIK